MSLENLTPVEHGESIYRDVLYFFGRPDNHSAEGASASLSVKLAVIDERLSIGYEEDDPLIDWEGHEGRLTVSVSPYKPFGFPDIVTFFVDDIRRTDTKKPVSLLAPSFAGEEVPNVASRRFYAVGSVLYLAGLSQMVGSETPDSPFEFLPGYSPNQAAMFTIHCMSAITQHQRELMRNVARSIGLVQ